LSSFLRFIALIRLPITTRPLPPNDSLADVGISNARRDTGTPAVYDYVVYPPPVSVRKNPRNGTAAAR